MRLWGSIRANTGIAFPFAIILDMNKGISHMIGLTLLTLLFVVLKFITSFLSHFQNQVSKP